MGPSMPPGQIPLLSLHEALFRQRLQTGSALLGRPWASDSLYLLDPASTLQKVQHSFKEYIYNF